MVAKEAIKEPIKKAEPFQQMSQRRVIKKIVSTWQKASPPAQPRTERKEAISMGMLMLV